MNYTRPKLIISVYVFNNEGNKLLVGKYEDDNTWGTLRGKLDYGENFEDCVSRILCNISNILVEDQERVKFICTYNAVDKENKNHVVSVDYYIQVTKEEKKFHVRLDSNFFQTWNWLSFEEILKLYDNLNHSFKVFIKKFNINKPDDIKNLVSN